MFCLLHIEYLSEVIFTSGRGFTFMANDEKFLQLLESVTVRKYVVDVEGDAIIVSDVSDDNPVEGYHEYEVPPEAMMLVELR